MSYASDNNVSKCVWKQWQTIKTTFYNHPKGNKEELFQQHLVEIDFVIFGTEGKINDWQ